MSFILDALKKSEAERQRQSVPGLMDMGPPAVRPRFPVWGIWLGGLLGINLIVLLVVLTRTSTAPLAATADSAAATPAAATATAAAPPASAAQPFSPMEPVGPPVYAPEIPVAQAAAAASTGAAPDRARAPLQQSPVQPLNPAQAFGPQLRVNPPPPEKNEVLPTLAEINLSGNRGIPELHLDIHVYAAKPAERFVFINNQKYKEGKTLTEGPTIERITRDGVVLSYQSLRFFLPRQP